MIFLTASTQYLKCKQKWLIWSPWRYWIPPAVSNQYILFSKGKFGDFINLLQSSWLWWLKHYTRWGRASPFFWPDHTYFLPHVYTFFLGLCFSKAVTRIYGAINRNVFKKMNRHFLLLSTGDIYCFAICSNMFHLSFLQYFVINIGLSLSTTWPASISAVLHGLFM